MYQSSTSVTDALAVVCSQSNESTNWVQPEQLRSYATRSRRARCTLRLKRARRMPHAQGGPGVRLKCQLCAQGGPGVRLKCQLCARGGPPTSKQEGAASTIIWRALLDYNMGGGSSTLTWGEGGGHARQILHRGRCQPNRNDPLFGFGHLRGRHGNRIDFHGYVWSDRMCIVACVGRIVAPWSQCAQNECGAGGRSKRSMCYSSLQQCGIATWQLNVQKVRV
jgi:hypothetical protein